MEINSTIVTSTICFACVLGFIPIWLLKANKIKSQNAITPFLWLIFIFSIIESCITIFMKLYPNSGYSSAYVFRIYTFLEFWTIYFYFKRILISAYNLFLKIGAIIFILLFLSFIFIWNANESMKTESYLMLFDTFFVLIVAFLWFKNNLEDTNKVSLFINPDFYYIFGFVFYFSTSIVLFLLSIFLQKRGYAEFWGFYIFNILFVIVWRILIIIGVWKARTK